MFCFVAFSLLIHQLAFLSIWCQALAVIEYLVSHGSERAVDDIIEHTFQISVRVILLHLASFSCNSQQFLQINHKSNFLHKHLLLLLVKALSSFEYVEPNGKDVGLNVRKKAENIVALLNDREKIHDVRNKAAANRDK